MRVMVAVPFIRSGYWLRVAEWEGNCDDGCTAAAYGMNDQLREILGSHPKDANDLETGNSPLGWVACGHQPASARILLRHGSIVDCRPSDA